MTEGRVGPSSRDSRFSLNVCGISDGRCVDSVDDALKTLPNSIHPRRFNQAPNPLTLLHAP